MASIPDQAQDISSMFPDIQLHFIKQDLRKTKSPEMTINNILDNTINLTCEIDSDPEDVKEDRPGLLERLNFDKKSTFTNNRCDVSPNHEPSDDLPMLYKPHTSRATKSTHSKDDIASSDLSSLAQPQSSRTGKTTYPFEGGSEHFDRPTNLPTSHKTSTGNSREEKTTYSFKRSASTQHIHKPSTDIPLLHELQNKQTVRSIRSDFVSDSSDSDTPIPADEIPTVSYNSPRKKQTKTESITSMQTGFSTSRGQKRPMTSEQEETKKMKLTIKLQKEEEKRRKQEEQKRLKEEKEFEKMRKKTLQQATRNFKPGECMKHLVIMLDPGVLKYPGGGGILESVQTSDLRYDIQPQVYPNIVTFWREVTEVREVGSTKINTEVKEVLENEVLFFLTTFDFVKLVDAYKQVKQMGVFHGVTESLTSWVKAIQDKLENIKVTLIVHGMDKYYKKIKNKENRNFRAAVAGANGNDNAGQVIVNKHDVEEALVDLQLQTGCNVRFLEAEKDVSKTVMQFAKGVAERPFKKDRMITGFSFHIDSSGTVKVDKAGNGLTQVWRQQLQVFKLVTAEVTNAIIAQYPSPALLCQAYANCTTEKEKELLLQDIMVRRGAGVMATARRVGKEVSRRIYQLFTSRDPDLVLK